MGKKPEAIVDLPRYGDKCATFREACGDAEQFARDFGCEAWVVRYDPECDNVWKVRAPAKAVALFNQQQRERQLEEDLEYIDREHDREIERESESWKGRYGTPWSAP